MRIKTPFILLIALAFLAFGCDPEGGSDSDASSGQDGMTQEDDKNESTLLEIEGQLFSIPSPIQTAFLIKEVGTTYDPAILNPAQNSSRYSTSFSKAINLGIYGADLGYITIYEKTQDAITYLTTVKKLAHDLGVSGAFDLKLLERFEGNIGRRDSLLALVSEAFKASDAYLKSNERNDVGALILAGGWIESLYFSTIVAKNTANDEVVTRIGAQKTTCANLVKLLQPYYQKPDYTALIDQLTELNEVFEQIEVVYTYKPQTVDAENKITTINSESDIIVTDEQLRQITEKIKSIRELVIN